jgi:cyclohexanecarboxylate-CoA ligase
MTATSLSWRAAERADLYQSNGWWPGERLTERFGRHVESDPGRPAVIDERGVALTRQDLWQRAGALAQTLGDCGVRAGDPVLIYLPNWVDWQVSLVAALRLGAVPATLPITTDAETLTYVYNLVGAVGIIASRSHRRATADHALQAASASGRSAIILSVDEGGGEKWDQITGAATTAKVPSGVDHLMFTSSTTGRPKAVMHTADTLAALNIGFSDRFGLTENTPIFMASPLGHSVGAWHGGRLSLFTGAPLVLQDRWDPVRALTMVEEHNCAFTAAATPFLKDLVDAPWPAEKTKLASLRTFLCGGAPVPPSLLEQANIQAPHTFVTVLWGMTEGGVTTCTPDSSREQLVNTAGAPLPGLELTVLDRTSDGTGELAMRGPGVFVGYFGQEQLYREALTEDGFFRTGDLARLDEHGYVRLTGRLKDLIIRGGVNIASTPIEDAIAAHPAVRRVAVIGLPDDRLGERICAVIVPSGTPPTLPELVAWVTDRGLSQRLLPEALRVVDEMPVTAAGKIRKADLKRSLGVDK